MKVLVIGHTYISKIGREKWKELVRLFDVELKIVVPKIWKDYLFTIKYEDQRDDELDIGARTVFFSGKEAAHFYLSLTFLLNSFKPDILHVEEGTDALSFFQALSAKRIFSHRSKSLFFTWMNWEKKLSFPFTFFEKHNLKYADAAIAGNSDAKMILQKKGFMKPISVMPLLGIDSNVFSKRDESQLRSELGLNGFVIGFLGRFVPEKGVLDLIDAASMIQKDFQLLFIGGGTLENEMKKRAEEKGIASRMIIVPSIPHTEVPRHLNCMDVLVLPSYTVPHWKEQFGQVLVQAMSCEVPVIGSSHAEIPRVINDAGLVFQEKNVDALASKLDQIISDENLRNNLKVKGRQRVLDNYTNTKIAEQTYQVYRSLLEK